MDYLQEQREEIESLKAIFPDEFTEICVDPPCFMVRVEDKELPAVTIQVKITFPRTYPDDVPLIEIPNRSVALSKELVNELQNNLESVAQESVGMVMVFTIINEAKEWITLNMEKINEDKIKDKINKDKKLSEFTQCINDDEEDDSTPSVVYADKGGGRWDYVIGLIGKPSAGKSTFFNAATKQNCAKIAAHPFTTIEPNIGKGFYSIPCPCSSLPKKCQAKFGHDAKGWRYVPVLLKDVAGLVPGACDGRGKGNKFLNDLLDADVLIHVIDVSGETDENGKQTSGYDPTLDVEWLYNELHQWVFKNVMAKWDLICKKPSKLMDMFTGYHVSKHLIQNVFLSLGITEKKMKAFFSLNSQDSEHLVHKLVREILKVRFPIMLALNKIDRPDSRKNIQKFYEKYKDMKMVPISGKSECMLQMLSNQGFFEYKGGDSELSFNNENPMNKLLQNNTKEILELVLKPFGGTGVLQAVSEAVLLRPPEYAFPVQCLDTLVSSTTSHKNGPILEHCIVLKKNTTVGKLFTVLCHPPLALFAGEFVRAECRDVTGKKRVMHKDEKITEDNQIVKIMSTKKGASTNRTK